MKKNDLFQTHKKEIAHYILAYKAIYTDKHPNDKLINALNQLTVRNPLKPYSSLASITMSKEKDSLLEILNATENVKEHKDQLIIILLRIIKEFKIRSDKSLDHPIQDFYKYYSDKNNASDEFMREQIDFLNERYPFLIQEELFKEEKKELLKEEINENLQKKKDELGFMDFSSAFQNVLKQKKSERAISRHLLLIIALMILGSITAVLIFTYIDNKTPQFITKITIPEMNGTLSTERAFKDAFANSEFNYPLIITKIILFSFLIGIALYFFRVALHEYHSIKAEILQLEQKIGIIGFVEGYVEFLKKEKIEINLEKFEEVVFSKINFETKNLPSSPDLINQITKLVEVIKDKK